MTLANVIVEFYEKMSSWEERVVEGTGLTLSQMHTIEILGIFGQLMMKDLALKVGVTTGTLTSTIDKLEEKDLVKRISNSRDRRSYFITLTPKGILEHKRHTQAHLEMTERCVQGFSERDKDRLSAMLKEFNEGLEFPGGK